MSKPRTAKVFEGHKCTTAIHNALLDVVMPELSPNAWKVLCVIIRQTSGWEREEQGANYPRLMEGAGIGSKSTLAKCLDELKTYRYQLISVVPGTQHEESRYSVNREVEIEWTPVNFAKPRSTENVLLKTAPRSTENGPLNGTENVLLGESRSTENGLSYKKESSISYLKQVREEETPFSTLSIVPPSNQPEAFPDTVSDALNEIFPGYADDEKKMMPFVALVQKLHGRPVDVRNWPDWFATKHPASMQSTTNFRESFHRMMKELNPGAWLNGSVGSRFVLYTMGFNAKDNLPKVIENVVVSVGKWVDGQVQMANNKDRGEWLTRGIVPERFEEYWNGRFPDAGKPKAESIRKYFDEFLQWNEDNPAPQKLQEASAA